MKKYICRTLKKNCVKRRIAQVVYGMVIKHWLINNDL